MPNGAHKGDAFFDVPTRVMENDLLQALTDESSAGETNRQTDASPGTAPRIDVVVAEPAEREVASATEPKLMAPVVAPSAPSVPTTTSSNVATALGPRREMRVSVGAGVIATIVLAFDASLFVLHHRRVERAAAAPVAPAAPEPLPRYMLLPLASPAPPVEAANAQPAPAPPPSTTPAVAAAAPNPRQAVVRAHRHSHHRHSSH